MNIIDILTLLVLLYAAYRGCHEGLVVQIFSIVGMAVSVWIGSKYSTEAADLLHIEGEYSQLLGFLIATIVVLIAIAFAGRLMRRLVNFSGFGSIDVVLGASLSVCKFLLILSLLFTAVNMANQEYDIFDNKELAQSKLYMPIANLCNHFTPVWNWANEQITNQL
ncbi:MAG: CvpA family protein [Rikenellaceae bacterium]